MNGTIHTNFGEIKIELFNDSAMETVKNFTEYANDGHYDGTIFHRVIEGFMIQGGGFGPEMAAKKNKDPIKNEAHNGKKNETGTLAMARTPDPHSATSQFFINLNDNGFLDFKNESPDGWGYCVFGKVLSGMDVVQKIEKVKTASFQGHQNVPCDDVIIEKVEISKK